MDHTVMPQMQFFIVGTPSLTWGWGRVPKLLLESGITLKKGGYLDVEMGGGGWRVPFFYYFTVQLLCYILILQSFELTMQDSHPSVYSTKMYHLYISDSF